MQISDLTLSNMQDLFCAFSTMNSSKTKHDVQICFDTSSKNKLSQILMSKQITRNNQDLFIDMLTVQPDDNDFITQGQTPFIKTSCGYSLTAQPMTKPHFKVVGQTLTTLKNDTTMLCAIEISLGNIELDFDNAIMEFSDGVFTYRNVGMTIYPGNYNIRILEE